MSQVDFKPETGWGWFILWCGVYGVMGFAMYQEWLSQAMNANSWEDRIGATLVVAFAFIMFYVVCLYMIFNSRRFSFSDVGFRVWTWRGPRFFLWKDVTRATLGKFRLWKGGGWVAVTVLMVQGDVVDIPLGLFKRRGSLLYELKRWLPGPLMDPRGLAGQLVNDAGES